MNLFLPFSFSLTVAAISTAAGTRDPRELVSYDFSRLDQLADSPLATGGLVAIVLALLLFTIASYVRESHSLPRFAGALLCLLRLLAISGAVLFFMNLQKRTDRQITQADRSVFDSRQSLHRATHLFHPSPHNPVPPLRQSHVEHTATVSSRPGR